jgi:hypothetical protein
MWLYPLDAGVVVEMAAKGPVLQHLGLQLSQHLRLRQADLCYGRFGTIDQIIVVAVGGSKQRSL